MTNPLTWLSMKGGGVNYVTEIYNLTEESEAMPKDPILHTQQECCKEFPLYDKRGKRIEYEIKKLNDKKEKKKI